MKYEGFAVDISNWSGEISVETVDRWHDAGVLRVIVGTQNERITRQQMSMIDLFSGAPGLDYGREVEIQAYVFLYDQWRDFADQVEEAVRRYAGFPVTKLWLDCEFATTAPPDVVVARIQNAVDYCKRKGINYGIYSANWWWQPMTDNSKEFSHIDLWNSRYYDLPPCHTIMSMAPGYGGWKVCQMWQYRGTTEFCGVTVDFNYFLEERMMQERIKELENQEKWYKACAELLQMRVYVMGTAMNAIYKGKWQALENIAKFMRERNGNGS